MKTVITKILKFIWILW